MAKSRISPAKKKTTSTRKSQSAAKKSPKTKSSTVKKKAPVAKKPTAAKKKATPVARKKKSADDKTVTVDRRTKAKAESVDSNERRQKSEPVAIDFRKLQRREKVTRRRQIDPTTCERDYTPEEVEFMASLDEYKRKNGRMFPTCSEILEVIRDLGYQKVQKTEAPVVEPTAVTPAPLPKLPEAPVLSLSSDFALPAENLEVFDF